MSVGDPAGNALNRLGSTLPAALLASRGGADAARLAAEAPPASRALATLAAALLGFALPVLMVIANKSAPATFVAAALAANGAALLAGRPGALGARYRALASAPPTLLVLSAAALCGVSLAWSIEPRLTGRGLLEAAPELAAALGLAAAWPLVSRPQNALWLYGGIAAAGLLILGEHLFGMPLHALVGARGEAWDLKRSAVPPLLLLWPAVLPLWTNRLFAAAAALAVAVATGIAAAHSGAPGAALACGAALFALALAAPRTALGFTSLGFAVLVLTAPWTGSLLSRALPPDARAELREEHAEHRLAIWTAFEHRGFDRPWLGHGFDTSYAVAEAPRPGGMPAPTDSAWIIGFHPHDIVLQVWVELGALGLAATAALFGFVVMLLRRRRGAALATRLGLAVAVMGVGLVGLSAWQPWWLAAVAAALLWFDHAERGA